MISQVSTVPVSACGKNGLDLTSVVAVHTPIGIWPALIKSSMLELNIHIETHKDTDCTSTVPHNCFVLFSLSLPTKRLPALRC